MDGGGATDPASSAHGATIGHLEETRVRVRAVLEDEVARVDSPVVAKEIVRRVEELASGHTEAEEGARAAASPAPADEAVERVARAVLAGGRPDEPHVGTEVVAEVLAQAAAETVAPTPEAPAVLEGAQQVLGPAAVRQQIAEGTADGVPVPAPPGETPPVRRGRRLLRQAMLDHLGPLQKVDARIYLLINGSPHPRWSDRAANAITIWATGGWIWAAGLLVARALGVKQASRMLPVLLPSVVGATFIVEHPIKAYFRRRRPFIAIVRALVVGKRPGSWSFPSGHTASSFASAWVLSTCWPRRAPFFYTLAATVGISRIYVGAHYPGDVVSGAVAGTFLAELIRRLAVRVLKR